MKTRTSTTLIPILLLLTLISLPAASWTVTEEWVDLYDSGPPHPHDDNVMDIAVDTAGNVYVTGRAFPEGMCTIKYSPGGTRLWVAHYDQDSVECARAITVDRAGNVYITGTAYPPGTGGFPTHAVTVKYDTDGNQLWAAQYYGPDGYEELASEIVVDGDGNVIVAGYTGWENPEGMDYLVIKYGSDGNMLWHAEYDGQGAPGYDYVSGLAVDAAGCIYVTGESSSPALYTDYFATVKYDPDGNQLWVARHAGPEGGYATPFALAMDGSDNVYVTGYIDGQKYTTIKYDTDGNQLWVGTYNDTPTSWTCDLAVDDAGYAVVAGRGITVRYAPDGTQMWAVSQYADSSDRGFDPPRLETYTALDAAGNIYVTSWNGVIKYSPEGAELWRTHFDIDYSGVVLAIDDESNVFVAGTFYDDVQFDFLTIKYSQSNTVSCQLSCLPSSGTVPFDTTISLSAANEVPGVRRRVALRLDLDLANGTHYSNWRAGTTTIFPGTPFTTSLVQTFPDDPGLIGTNRIVLVTEDVTPAPYNLPPRLPAGDKATASCTIEGIEQ